MDRCCVLVAVMDDMKNLAIDTAINGDPNARIYTQALHTIIEQAARIAELEAALDAPSRHAYKVGISVGRMGAMKEAACVAYAKCAETRHVKLGIACERAILAILTKEPTHDT